MQARFSMPLAALVLPLLIGARVDAAVIDQITVTATKRGELDVQSLGEAVYAVTGDSLEDKNQFDFEDFALSVPGLQFQDLGPGDKEYIIRGINGNGPSVVGAYFDEYVISANDQQDGGGKNAPIKLVDLERIEVLNGPQGTLYGANSMAGNIRFIPRKPDAEAFDAYVNTDISNTTSEGGFNFTVNGALNVPLADTFALRLVGWLVDNDGWIDQPRLQTGPTSFDGNAKDINTEETAGGRLMFRWTPSDAVTVDGLFLTQNMEIGGSSRFTAKGVPAWPDQPPEIASLPGNTGFTPLTGITSLTPSEDFQNSDITVNTRDDDVTLLGLTAAFESGIGTTTISASRYEHDIDFVFDSTPILLFFGVDAPGVTVQPQTYETNMLEVRFASSFDGFFNFVVGGYYQEDENNFEVNVVTTDGRGNPVPWDPLDANDFFGGGTAFFGRFRDDEIERLAAFGEATFDIVDNVTLTVGGRWFDVDLTSTQATLHNFGGGASLPAGTIIGTTVNGNSVGRIETSDDTIKPKVGISWDVTDDLLLYALYSEGFRVGGVNNSNQPFAMGIPATFESDDLQNIEAGIKSQWLDGSLQFNSTIFMIEWDKIQVEPRDPAGNIPFTTNGGSADLLGIEWATTYLPTDFLQFDFSGTFFLESELSTNQPVLPGASPFVIVGQKGDDLPNVPELQFYAAGKYTAQLGDMPLDIILDVSYRDDTNTEFRPNNAFNIKLDSYTIVNLYANLSVTDNFKVGAYVKNLTDELAVYDGIGTFQDPESIVANRPLTFGITANIGFE